MRTRQRFLGEQQGEPEILPAFATQRDCTMCGSTHLRHSYRPAGFYVDDTLDGNGYYNRHMEVMCDCEYTWLERTLEDSQ